MEPPKGTPKPKITVPAELLDDDDDDEDDFIGLTSISVKARAMAKAVKEDPEIIRHVAAVTAAKIAADGGNPVVVGAKPQFSEEKVTAIDKAVEFFEAFADSIEWLAQTISARNGELVLRIPSEKEVVELVFKDKPAKNDVGFKVNRAPLA